MNYEQKYKSLITEIKERKTLISAEKEKASSQVDKLSLGGRVAILQELLAFTHEFEESEDKRIRKELLEHCINRRDGKQICVDASDYRRWAAWLEKQGEQKSVEYSLEQAAEIFLDSLAKTPYNNKPVTDAQVITKELLKFLSDTNSYNPNAINEQTLLP